MFSPSLIVSRSLFWVLFSLSLCLSLLLSCFPFYLSLSIYIYLSLSLSRSVVLLLLHVCPSLHPHVSTVISSLSFCLSLFLVPSLYLSLSLSVSLCLSTSLCEHCIMRQRIRKSLLLTCPLPEAFFASHRGNVNNVKSLIGEKCFWQGKC